MLRSTTKTLSPSFRHKLPADTVQSPHNGHADRHSLETKSSTENGGQTDDGDDDDDSDCVSIIDCQMVNGDGPQHSDPEYYFDEDTGQIIVCDRIVRHRFQPI